ncbi:MAG: HTTM domain-containing protein [Alphaproteobacteria bacterium]|nr:HTTM domain-containing protein [Alphaproteobacteria bacterium]
MTGLWQRWVDFTGRPMDTRPLALVRIFAALCVLVDLLRLAQLRLVTFLFTPYEQGGLSQVQDSSWRLDELLGPTVAGPVSYAVSLVCMALIALGVAVRPAIVIGVLAYAQLGHAYPPGDRAIDRVLRLTLLFLLFSQAHRRFALSNVLGWTKRLDTAPAWPADLIRSQLVMVYMAAGLSKIMQQPLWVAVTGTPVLYRIMTDPMAATLDPEAWEGAPWLFYAGGIGTIVLEVGAFVILTRLAPYWALLGLGMHLGIAMTMKLGMFSFGMMSLYPILLGAWICAGLDRLGRRGGRWAALGRATAEAPAPGR